jgi:hypothetical protein
VLTIVLSGVAVLAVVPLMNEFMPLSAVRGAVGLTLLATWVFLLIKFVLVSAEYGYWSCPRCGKPFHYAERWFGRWNNPFARRCVHCGLPKWVNSDPEPKLKHELDPFRSDSIFKMSDTNKRP